MTYTLELEKDKSGYAWLVVEVDREGDVIQAQSYDQVLDMMRDCTDELKSRTTLMEMVREAFEEKILTIAMDNEVREFTECELFEMNNMKDDWVYGGEGA